MVCHANLAHGQLVKCSHLRAPAKYDDTELIDRLASIVEHHAVFQQLGGEDGRNETQQEVCQTFFPRAHLVPSSSDWFAMMTYFKLGISPKLHEEKHIILDYLSITITMGPRVRLPPPWPKQPHCHYMAWEYRGDRLADSKLEANGKEMRSDINWVIMDYLVSEGYPGAAEKFAQETNLCQPADIEHIKERVKVRNAIHAGKVDEAIGMINEMDPEILDSNPLLHFQLLQLHLIEIIRGILNKPSSQQVPAQDFLPAIQFATDQLAPRAPTDPKYQAALERTMALMIFPQEKMTAEFKELLDLKLREKVASDVNKAMLEARGDRQEAKIRQLVRARAWAEVQAREANVSLPKPFPIGLHPDDFGEIPPDAMVT